MSTRPQVGAGSSAGETGDPDLMGGSWEVVETAGSLGEAAARLVELACFRAGADAARLSTRDEGGEVVPLATRGALLDETRDGPGVGESDPSSQALADGGVLTIPDTHADASWPIWSRGAAARGIGSAHFLGLPHLAGAAVTLELYAHRTHAFDGPAAALVAGLAHHAGIALRHAARFLELEQAAATRALVAQASGILMERYHLGADQSMSYLARSSERARLPLPELAGELVAAQDRAADRTRRPFTGPDDRTAQLPTEAGPPAGSGVR